MRIQPYEPAELELVGRNRVFLHSRTHSRIPRHSLSALTTEVLSDLLSSSGVQVLETDCDAINLRLLLNLGPQNSVSASVSLAKRQISTWLREQEGSEDARLLSRGYLALTAGSTCADALHSWLRCQSVPDAVLNSSRAPAYTLSFQHSAEARARLETEHALTVLSYHIVLATRDGHGVFDRHSASSVVRRWEADQKSDGYLLERVSFLPNHVHLAVSLHPSHSPREVIVQLMNAAQRVMREQLEAAEPGASGGRLWQSGAWLGSYGRIRSASIGANIRHWFDVTE